jgi:hypothetical protein
LVASKSPTWSIIFECLKRAGIEAKGIHRYCTTLDIGLIPLIVPKEACLNVVADDAIALICSCLRSKGGRSRTVWGHPAASPVCPVSVGGFQP